MSKTRKKVLFHYPVFNIGGAEKSVMRMMNLLIDSGWDVSLVLTTGGGVLENQLDSRIKVYHLRPKEAGSHFLAARSFIGRLKALPDLFLYASYRLLELFRSFLFLFRRYDAAIISLHGLSATFCCNWVRAKKRFQWVRNDLKQCDPDGKAVGNINKHIGCIDHYMCVAGTARDSLIELFPEIKSKAQIFYNVLESHEIIKLSKEKISLPVDEQCIKVVSVCRLHDKAKGLLRMVEAHKILDDQGVDFRWLVVGGGSDYELISKKIYQLGLVDKFFLVGQKLNPYPWLACSDAVAVLSYYEGLCGVINEAKVLGKPVISTEVSGVREQIEHLKNGLIVENELVAIIDGLRQLLSDNGLRESLTNTYLPTSIADDSYKAELFQQLVFGETTC